MTDPLLEESDIIPVAEVEGVSTENVETSDLQEITALSESLKEADNDIAAKEAELSQLKAIRKQISEELIPDLMNKNGLKLIQLDTGAKIQINEFVDARIKDPGVAFDWLRETNNDSIIKNQITISLDRGDDGVAEELTTKLKEEYGIDADRKIAIHHATLKSFCRDALEDPELAESLPREAFGIYQGQRAKLT
jgi:hypothetical protein|tara:strand:- start:1810 stop:2391 length:582 start_codon:yes stop_codon:yes gene_type:complete